MAVAGEIPIRDFFRHAEFTEIELSPTGEYLAVTVPQDDRTLLAVLRTGDKSIVSKWDYGKNQHPFDLEWVNDERFLVRVAEKNGLYDFWVGTPDIFAANADGTQRTKLVMGGTYQVVDLLEKDPRRILVQRAVERPNLFRMDVYTGRLFKEAVSPVEMGSFAVDHDGNVRYAFGMTEDMRLETYRRDGTDRWTRIFESDSHSGMRFPIGFTADNSKIYMAFSTAGEPAGAIDGCLVARQEAGFLHKRLMALLFLGDPVGVLLARDGRLVESAAFHELFPFRRLAHLAEQREQLHAARQASEEIVEPRHGLVGIARDITNRKQAEQELPDQVDTERDSGLLEKLGINPQDLLGKLGGGLGGLLGGHLAGRRTAAA